MLLNNESLNAPIQPPTIQNAQMPSGVTEMPQPEIGIPMTPNPLAESSLARIGNAQSKLLAQNEESAATRGANYQFSVQSMADKAIAKGQNPNAAYAPGTVADPKATMPIPTVSNPGRRPVPKISLAMAGGGDVSDAAKLAEEIRKKYGVGGGSTPAPEVQTPAPAPAPVAPPPKKESGGIFGLFKNRGDTINKAAGMKKGGKVRNPLQDLKQGGEIKGPGTPTSDDVPIMASDTEYMLPAKAVAALGGPEALDALVLALTGEKPGAKIIETDEHPATKAMCKGGKTAHMDDGGKVPGDQNKEPRPEWRGWLEPKATPVFDPQTHVGVTPLIPGLKPGQQLNRLGGDNPLPAIASVLPAESPVRKMVDGFEARSRESEKVAEEDMRDKRMAQLMNKPDADGSAATVPTTDAAPVQNALQAAQAEHMIANNLRDFRDAGGGIAVQRGADGKVTMTNVGTEGITNQNPLYTDIHGKPTNDWKQTAQYAQGVETAERMKTLAAKMEAERLGTDREATIQRLASSGDRTNVEGARAMAGAKLYNPMEGLLAEQQAQSGKVDMAVKNQAIERAQQLRSLVESAAAEADPAKRSALIESALAMQGKDMKEHQYLKLKHKKFNEMGVPIEEYDVPFNTGTGKEMKAGQQQEAAPTKEYVQAALKKLPKEEVARRIKAGGFDPKTYGL